MEWFPRVGWRLGSYCTQVNQPSQCVQRIADAGLKGWGVLSYRNSRSVSDPIVDGIVPES